MAVLGYKGIVYLCSSLVMKSTIEWHKYAEDKLEDTCASIFMSTERPVPAFQVGGKVYLVLADFGHLQCA